jgi:hypothetical protein
MATGIEKYMTKLPILPDPAIGDGLDIPDTIYQQWAAEDRELTPEIYPIDANAREQLTSEAGDELPELPRTAAFHADTNQPDFAVSAHLLRQVVRTNRWIRPVYLAASGYPDHFNGIEPYLREEGFVARLFPDTGVDYDAQAQRWIDSTRFESSLRSAITMIPHSDGLVAGYLDGLFLGRETVTFFKWLDSSRSMDFLSLIRPIVRANATYPFTETSVLYIDQYNKGHNELRSDLEWFSKAMSEELRQHPNEVPWYNFILAEDYAALKNCSELRALSDSTPNSNETWRRVKDLIQPLVDNCK